ncbi:MAG: hypothetical protein IAI50_05675, partial [Candidatus Eremiobacteraeota bacterium]|nr:hypothetical protein [Candidatus Eremiobacteraeota bacterium]
MRLAVFRATAFILTTFLAACGGGGGSVSTSSYVSPTQPVTFAGGTPLVPTQGIYIGAFANTGAGLTDEQGMSALEAAIGRTLALSMHYYGWTDTFPSSNEAQDAQVGRIPVLSWNCGPANSSIAAGAEDANIIAHADALRAFGKPVFLRYQWEMNFPAIANKRTSCYDPATDNTGGVFSPAEFIAAWNHIHAIFVARGATNVAFLWNPGGAGPINAALYYPGASTVDWVGIDEYDRFNVPFANVFSIYPAVVGYRKPILIA